MLWLFRNISNILFFIMTLTITTSELFFGFLLNLFITTAFWILIAKYSVFSKYFKGPRGYPGAVGPCGKDGEKGDTVFIHQKTTDEQSTELSTVNEVVDKRINVDYLSEFYETTKETIERHEEEIDSLVSLLNYAFTDKLMYRLNKDVYAINQINEFKNNVTSDVFPIITQLFNSLGITFTKDHTSSFIDSMLKIQINEKLAMISDIKRLLETTSISGSGKTIFELDVIQNRLLKIKI